MIKVGIIGCGKMADKHANGIKRIPDVEIAAVCDRELLMAQDMNERFNIPKYFTDVQEMLQTVKLELFT